MTHPENKLHLPEGSYVAYIEGVAPPDVVAHIEACDKCQKEVQGLIEVEALIRKAYKEKGSS